MKKNLCLRRPPSTGPNKIYSEIAARSNASTVKPSQLWASGTPAVPPLVPP